MYEQGVITVAPGADLDRETADVISVTIEAYDSPSTPAQSRSTSAQVSNRTVVSLTSLYCCKWCVGNVPCLKNYGYRWKYWWCLVSMSREKPFYLFFSERNINTVGIAPLIWLIVYLVDLHYAEVHQRQSSAVQPRQIRGTNPWRHADRYDRRAAHRLRSRHQHWRRFDVLYIRREPGR